MIDDHHRKLAALYAGDRLAGPERSAFEAALASDADLRALVDQLRTSARTQNTPPGSPPSILRTFLPWSIAACFALACAGFAQLYLSSHAENALFRNQAALAELELRGVRQQLEAERLLARRELADTRLASLQIVTLAAPPGTTSKTDAVIAWNPATQEGLLRADRLPPPAPDHEYRLWIIDPAYPVPVDAGLVAIDPAKPGPRIHFRPTQPVGQPVRFAISLERKPTGPRPEAPFLLLSH